MHLALHKLRDRNATRRPAACAGRGRRPRRLEPAALGQRGHAQRYSRRDGRGSDRVRSCRRAHLEGAAGRRALYRGLERAGAALPRPAGHGLCARGHELHLPHSARLRAGGSAGGQRTAAQSAGGAVRIARRGLHFTLRGSDTHRAETMAIRVHVDLGLRRGRAHGHEFAPRPDRFDRARIAHRADGGLVDLLAL